MTTIYLIRHGEVAGNSGAIRTFAGSRDLELTPRGIEQARAIAARMKDVHLDAVYASKLQRAWRTADGIAATHGLQTQRLGGWNEVDYGAWEGLSEAEINADYADLWKQRVADPWTIAPHDGESYRMLWARLEPEWTRLLENHSGQTVAVVGHNGSLRVLLCQLLGAPPKNARRLQIGNCSLTKVSVDSPTGAESEKLEGPPLVISYINDTSHLSEVGRI